MEIPAPADLVKDAACSSPRLVARLPADKMEDLFNALPWIAIGFGATGGALHQPVPWALAALFTALIIPASFLTKN
jgi:hypothetical protein